MDMSLFGVMELGLQYKSFIRKASSNDYEEKAVIKQKNLLSLWKNSKK